MTSDSRGAYVKKLKAWICERNTQIEKIDAKACKADAQTRGSYEAQLEHLRGRRDDLQQRLDDICDAGEDAWRNL